MSRTSTDWSAIYVAANVYSDLAITSEERGYCTWAWDTLESLRVAGRFTLLVGPTPFKACPTFRHWLHWSEHPEDRGYRPQERPLILLDLVPLDQQVRVLEAASTS
eukprot:3855126-Rhodomonas_salina.1